jgi:hypothetical protein
MRQQLAVLCVALLLAGCGRAQPRHDVSADTVRPSDTARVQKAPVVSQRSRTIDEVLAAHNDSLLALPGVLGTAAARCEGSPCIRVLVSRMSDELRRRLPSQLEGFPVRVDVTGPVVPR